MSDSKKPLPVVRVRPVTAKDSEHIRLWRNDPETRRQFATPEVTVEEHAPWFAKLLAGGFPGRILTIVEDVAGTLVGSVRSDIRPDNFHFVSYIVAPEARGKGFGKVMVRQFIEQYLPSGQVVLLIKKGNIASEKIAEALGLKVFKEEPPQDPGSPPMREWRSAL